MPLTGIWQLNVRRIQFSFKSLPAVVTLVFMLSSSVLFLCMLKHLIKISLTAKNLVGQVFFACVQCACILFIDLARHWPALIRYWTRVELIFNRPPYEMLKRNLTQRVRRPAIIIVGLSLIEHGLYVASAVLSYRRRAYYCIETHNSTSAVSFDNYIMQNYDYVFQILPYTKTIAIFILIANGACTFVWNYMDLFIMMISKGLAYRFEQISARIRKLEHEEQVKESTFIEIREHFVRMCELLEKVDNALSSIILLSCINNLYFVCCQLLNIFNKLRWPINYIYFWYSMLYLVGRTACVFLTAATINDQSKSALGVLRRVSSKNWCVELKRFSEEVHMDQVALTGMKFFRLTRSVVISVAGTIVTYELILLQFNKADKVNDCYEH
ncbi:gustatory receptor for sugar taste 64a [Drosophila busckii]|uniref:gustatory receptor for sugar taste 64a n=1 Tax=Drosophila busckii TaxID=30019 RepID=UPI001432BFBB|nr:gustatory receptor for sugar taste 64a [Drosophila busckii]